jgi:hypothetical protein
MNTNPSYSQAIDSEDYHYRFKVVVLGDLKSGKSTFLDSITYLRKLLLNTMAK